MGLTWLGSVMFGWDVCCIVKKLQREKLHVLSQIGA